MEATTPRDETTGGLESALSALPPADQYLLLGVAFSLRTDSTSVRDFFRAAYKRFRCLPDKTAKSLDLYAVMAPSRGGPFARAGEAAMDLSGRPMPENRAFLFLLNALMDHVADYLLIHGAAISVGGRGIILAGPPTAGKSTLVLELARRGATFFSDDVAPLERSTGLLHPFPRAIGVRLGSEEAMDLESVALPQDALHKLPHKWLVDPEALGLEVAGPAAPPCPVEAVILLESFGRSAWGESGDGTSSRAPARRLLEIALVEADPPTLAELGAIQGVGDLRPVGGKPFPLYTFTAERSSRPMAALAGICRRRRDVILYLDEARPSRTDRPAEPELQEAPWSGLLMELARDLLNRSDTGKLMSSCGGLPALVSEMGGLLKGVRGYRLRPGHPERTADLILALAARDGRAHTNMRGAS